MPPGYKLPQVVMSDGLQFRLCRWKSHTHFRSTNP